jgi:hypothetical protein
MPEPEVEHKNEIIDSKVDEAKNEPVQAAQDEDIDWTTELAEGTLEPKGKFEIDSENIGIWINKGTSDMGYKIQQYAKRYGWGGEIIEDPEDDAYYATTQNAQTYLTNRAPAGFFFGTSKDGDWGMWENVSRHENPNVGTIDEPTTSDILGEEPPRHDTKGNKPKRQRPDLVGKKPTWFTWPKTSKGQGTKPSAAELAGAFEGIPPDEQIPPEEQEKDIMEMTDEDREKEIAEALEGEEKATDVKSEGTKTTAAIDPNKLQWSKEGGDAVSKDETGNVVSKVPWAEFEQKSPEIAGKVTTSSVLEEVSILSEFHDDLYPLIANAVIDNGVKVFIKPLNRFGTVVRVLDDSAFRVEANEKIATYFREELEVRQTSE